MTDDNFSIVACRQCGTKNRVPGIQGRGKPVCGKCKAPLDATNPLQDKRIDVTDTTFQREVAGFSGTVLLDFTAPW